MSLLAQTFITEFETYCPLSLAEVGDPVGLHIGSLNKDISKVMVALDIRPEVVAEAIKKKVDLIITKHPPIFRPVSRLLTDDPQTKMYIDLARHDIGVYAAHTNLDIIENGVNDWFCELLSIGNTDFLRKTHSIPYLKLEVFVPNASAEVMRIALSKAGAGTIGTDYEKCSFSQEGVGRFTPVNMANPTIGSLNKEAKVSETKIEVVFIETLREKVLNAMHFAHPYEEPAFDVVQLENEQKSYGIGRIGDLAEPTTLAAFSQLVKKVFCLENIRVILPPSTQKDTLIQRVAICGGSGEKFFRDALKQKADVYITGDVYYHTAHDMQAEGLLVIDPGHHIEQLCIPRLVELFNKWKEEKDWKLTFIESETNTNPFMTI